MKVFVAGATGAIGKRLMPALVREGYQVVGMTRSPDKAPALRRLGAEAVVADALDRAAVTRVIEGSAPDVVVHQLTGLAGVTNFRNFDDEFALTNRLRTAGTDHLIAAAEAVGAQVFVAQSYGNWIYERSGSPVKTEADPLDPTPLSKQRKSLAAIRHLEESTTRAEGMRGIALRYGSLYGPGTSFAADGDVTELVRSRRFPVIGRGTGIWSFIHVDDAASATIAAIRHGTRGVYNVADDDPAPVAAWLPELARVLGAKSPRPVPKWLGRLAAGEVAVSLMTSIRGMSNAKARRELGWSPEYESWRVGFRKTFT